MVTEAHWQYWKYEDLVPYLDIVFEAFGADRCMYGSDWPVCLCAADNYQVTLDILLTYIKDFSKNDKSAVLSNNCLRAYGVKS